jgi:hypothetical protein
VFREKGLEFGVTGWRRRVGGWVKCWYGYIYGISALLSQMVFSSKNGAQGSKNGVKGSDFGVKGSIFGVYSYDFCVHSHGCRLTGLQQFRISRAGGKR